MAPVRPHPARTSSGLLDAALDKVRLYLRLAFRWEWLSPGQCQHAARQVAEIGKLLCGWKGVTNKPVGT